MTPLEWGLLARAFLLGAGFMLIETKAVVQMALDQVGKPYVWDAAGPDGYDCSGLVSAVYLALKGKNPFNHLFSTSNEAGFPPWGGRY